MYMFVCGLDNLKNFFKCDCFGHFIYLFIIYLPGKYYITTITGKLHLDSYSIFGRKLLILHWDMTCDLFFFICIIESSGLGAVQNSFSF